MQSDWTFELAKSADLSRIGELTQARGRSLTVTLNRAGAFQFNLPLDDRLADDVREIETCALISFKGEVVWSGAVWTVSEQITAADARLNVDCIGWLQTLDKRVVRSNWNNGNPVSYVNDDAGEIALDLLRRTNEDAFYAGAPNYIFPGTAELTQLRTRNYAVWQAILPAIQELTEIEAGFDMFVHPVERTLDIVARRQNDLGVVFELGTNVAQVTRQADSGRVINYFNAYSAAGIATVIDPEAIGLGLFEEAQPLSDVIGPNAATYLHAFAAAEVAIRSRPLPIITFQPMSYSTSRPDDPRPFEDYDIGDVVYLTARRGRMKIERQPLRIYSYTINFLDNGSEQVSEMQTVASG